MMTATYYESGNYDEFDNNEDKICLLLKDSIDRSHVKSHAKSHDFGSCEYGITIVFFFGMSSDEQIIVKKLFAIR